MVELHNLKPAPGSKPKKKRLGRGNSSGHGSKCGRGDNGQLSRSGYSRRFGFEGGHTPLWKRFPKRGFNNKFRTEYEILNVRQLNGFQEDTEIDPEFLKEKGMIAKSSKKIKILGDGELEIALSVRAHNFSETAKEKIEDAGGETEEI